jgi:hypothetical protein
MSTEVQEADAAKTTLDKLSDRVEDLSINIEKMKIAEYVDLLGHPAKLLFINFIAGVARGIGLAVGATILGAVLLIILSRMVDLPLIGGYIAQIVKIVQQKL